MPESAHRSILGNTDKMGVLTREMRIRLLNCSSSGCLVETKSSLKVGTIGSLRLTIDGEEFVDDLMVVRCQPIEGSGSVFHVGAKFLWTEAPGRKTLRRAMQPQRVVASLTDIIEMKPRL